MSGKQHMAIGCSVVGAVLYYKLGGNFNPSNVKDIVVPTIVGAASGSLWVDIDSSRSKASQYFNKSLIVILCMFVLMNYFNLSILHNVFNFFKHSLISNLWLTGFVILTILGKLSPHRGFTHKWLGSLLILSCAYFSFNKFVSFGFMNGYLLHIIADRFTKDGKNLRFFEFKLPMMNSSNKLSIHW